VENQMIKIPDLLHLRTSFRDVSLWLVFLGILLCYALLIFPTINRLGIGWDEATDLGIARAYLTPSGLLLGSSRDLSQTRLPMFMVAVIFHLLGTSNLLLARITTVFVGALTILGIFLYGKDRFTPATGLLAAGLLAINPFFLSFARSAFTESDVYLACTLTWLLIAFSRLREKPTIGWAMLNAIFLSFAISSKATALVVLPVVAGLFLLGQFYPVQSATGSQVSGLNMMMAHSIWLWCGWAAFIMLAGILISRQLNAGAYPRILHLFNYGLIWFGWLITLGWMLRYRNYTAPPTALATLIVGFSLLTFVIFPPEHLANSGIVHTLISRAAQEMTFSAGFMMELAALHVFTIFLKSTPILGFGLLAGYVISLTQWRRRELTLPLLIVTVYLSALLLLPLGQTFYTIPLLPILSLLLAIQLLRLVSKRGKIYFSLLVLGLIWWGIEVKQCYPDYHLNGYQWLGARPFFGRSTIGYRSIVYVPSDGVQQAVEWLNRHAETGQVALLYLEPWFLVKELASHPAYEFKRGLEDSLTSKPDYVAVHINSTILQGEGSDIPKGSVFRYPFEVDILQNEYEQVFSVRRAFNLEVVSIWRRK
jgi:hypothetical protein